LSQDGHCFLDIKILVYTFQTHGRFLKDFD
jgi:hypothetical protein